MVGFRGINTEPSIDNPSPKVCIQPKIRIYSSLDGRFVCEGLQCSNHDKISKALVDTFAEIHEFFSNRFDLCGIFRNEIVLPPIFRDLNDDNAWWDPNHLHWQINNKFVRMKEVIVHEYTHAINHGRLQSIGQARALNESLSDVMGLYFKHVTNKNSQDWNLGTSRNASIPAHMSQFPGSELNQEEHEYSKVPTHAYYRAVQSAIALGISNAESVIVSIWFNAMKRLQFKETFNSFAEKTLTEIKILHNQSTRKSQEIFATFKDTRALMLSHKKRIFHISATSVPLQNRRRDILREMNGIEQNIHYRRVRIAQEEQRMEWNPTNRRVISNARRSIRYHNEQLTKIDAYVTTLASSLRVIDAKLTRANREIGYYQTKVRVAAFESRVLDSSERGLKAERQDLDRVALAVRKGWHDVGVI